MRGGRHSWRMRAQLVDGSLAELAGVLFGDRRSQTQSHRHPNGVIVQMKTQVGHGYGLHPGGSVWLGGGEESRPGHLVGSLQQMIAAGLGEHLVPGPLFSFFPTSAPVGRPRGASPWPQLWHAAARERARGYQNRAGSVVSVAGRHGGRPSGRAAPIPPPIAPRDLRAAAAEMTAHAASSMFTLVMLATVVRTVLSTSSSGCDSRHSGTDRRRYVSLGAAV